MVSSPKSDRWITSWVTLWIVLSTWCSVHGQEVPNIIRPAETDANLLCATDKWAVWQTEEFVEASIGNRAREFIYRFYLQRLTEGHASLVYTRPDVRTGKAGTVTDDGTFVLATSRHLSYHTPGRKAVMEETRVPLLALYPDGGLIHDSLAREPQPVEFVPFKNHRLDLDNRIEVAKPGELVGIPANRQVFVRHQNRLAILTYRFDEAERRKRPDFATQPLLYTFDLDSKARQTTPLAVKLHPSSYATAFDGDLVTSFSIAFEAKTGKLVSTTEHPDSGNKPPRKVFAVRHRIGYFIRQQTLYATDLTSKELPTIQLSAAPKQTECPQSDDGLIVWNGTTWETIPWLEGWPRK